MSHVTVFADASFCGQTKAAAFAFWARNHTQKIQRAVPIRFRCDASTDAELFALAYAIICAVDELACEEGDTVVAESDCLHAIEILNGDQSGNAEQQEMRQSVRNIVARHGLALYFKHVKAHTDRNDPRSSVNRWCDVWAKRVMRNRRAALRKEALA